MNGISLFTIENEIKTVLESLSDDSVDKNILISNLYGALIEKTDQVIAYRESLKNYGDILEEKIAELKERKDFYERKIERFDEYILSCLLIQEKSELSGEIYKLKKRKPSLLVSITDESKIPIEFIKIPEIKPTIMKAEIAKLLKQGEIIEGAELVEGKSSIQYSLK